MTKRKRTHKHTRSSVLTSTFLLRVFLLHEILFRFLLYETRTGGNLVSNVWYTILHYRAHITFAAGSGLVGWSVGKFENELF